MDFDQSDFDLKPVATVSHLVDFLLCEENNSTGCNYIRGWIAYLDGALLSSDNAAMLLFLLRDDREVYDLVMQVAFLSGMMPTDVITQTVDTLTRIYEEHNGDE